MVTGPDTVDPLVGEVSVTALLFATVTVEVLEPRLLPFWPYAVTDKL